MYNTKHGNIPMLTKGEMRMVLTEKEWQDLINWINGGKL